MRSTRKPQPHAFVVNVSRTEPGAYNPGRPLSGLLESQIRRLHEPERRLPRRHHTGVDVGMIKTEGEAAAYIGRVTAAIHAHARATARKAAADRRTHATRKTKPRRKKTTKARKPATGPRTAARRRR